MSEIKPALTEWRPATMIDPDALRRVRAEFQAKQRELEALVREDAALTVRILKSDTALGRLYRSGRIAIAHPPRETPKP